MVAVGARTIRDDLRRRGHRRPRPRRPRRAAAVRPRHRLPRDGLRPGRPAAAGPVPLLLS
ncbi:MAG: hypothetical protein E6G01_16940 [Actinobacteria bacterium]|nr:MAG: hypothetical protein E6G01_16940 [Actinomycetota bacterium]